jgi:hypothetical protein
MSLGGVRFGPGPGSVLGILFGIHGLYMLARSHCLYVTCNNNMARDCLPPTNFLGFMVNKNNVHPPTPRGGGGGGGG